MKQEEDGIKYFWDSYAIIELGKSNPNYEKYIQEPVLFTIFNLAEIYWNLLNELDEKEANNLYERYSPCVVNISDDILKEAIKFRKEHKKKDLSYADCIGYTYSKKTI